MAQPKIFVSHSHVDDAFAERLVQDLRAEGVDVWLDKIDVGAGDFMERINDALSKCEWFVLVLTHAALESQWVRQEVHAANGLKHQGRIRDLIFVKAGEIEQHTIPALWSIYNIFDATIDYDSALEQIKKAVERSQIDRPLSLGDVPLAQIQQALLGGAPGAICPGCSTFNPLDDAKMIVWMSQASLFDPYVHARCKKCGIDFGFTPPDTNQ